MQDMGCFSFLEKLKKPSLFSNINMFCWPGFMSVFPGGVCSARMSQEVRIKGWD